MAAERMIGLKMSGVSFMQIGDPGVKQLLELLNYQNFK
jgi:hypothetical protein